MSDLILVEKSVYLAGPVTGWGYDDIVGWRDVVKELLEPEIVAYSPFRGKHYLSDEKSVNHSYEEYPLSSQRGIFARDMNDCYTRDLLFVNFIGAETVSIGTVIELTNFWTQKKPIVCIMDKDDKVHKHPMVLEMCPFIVQDLETAVDITKAILLP
jgi:nucleoside 2-deoxyribosyltransferase